MGKRRTKEEWVEIANELASNNGGVLPAYIWLRKNKYGGLQPVMQKNPDLFSHLTQEYRNGKPVTEWVPVAEKLASDNGGALPRFKWLKDNGYRPLYTAMKQNPDLFSHILEEEKTTNTPEEWVIIAEELASENGGKLYSNKGLKSKGYDALNLAMSINKHLFAHISREYFGGNTPEENVALAKRLATENGGVLPGYSWLRNNGFGGLAASIHRNREWYADIKQDYFFTTLEEWVVVAEGLAKENNGLIPNSSWLQNNGYLGLSHALNKYPSSFSNLVQDSKVNTPEEWVVVAEGLAKENNGLIPNSSWLQNNGYTGLPVVLRKQSELFSHLVWDSKVKTLEEWVIIAEELADEYDGILPRARYLIDNCKLGGLVCAMSKSPDLFMHITQDRGKSGFNDSLSGVYYLFEFDSTFDKGGIAGNVVTRVGKLSGQYANGETHNIIGGGYYKFDIGIDARMLESKILKHFKPSQYTGLLDEDFDGKTELFHKSAFKKITAFIKKHAPNAEYVPFSDIA